MTATIETTVGDIVASDFRAAAVFHKFGIDFCCGGGVTLSDACQKQHVSAGAVLEALTTACAAPDARTPRFNSWDVSTLVSYRPPTTTRRPRGPAVDQAHAQARLGARREPPGTARVTACSRVSRKR
jgi:regulator of cell morphogenesis and NO signaling